MRKFFGKIKDWLKRHKPTKRRLIQVYAALLCNANIKGFVTGSIYKGKTKYACVPGLNCYSCPGATGACPLGALQNALGASGATVPYYVFGIILLFGLILGRTICGFLCPVGLGQELLYKIKTPKLKKSKYTRICSYLKYVILVGLVIAVPLMFGLSGSGVPAFCKYICPAGTFGGAIGLLINPANETLFAQLGSLFTWKFVLLVGICVASIFIFRFFCRFLCPLGALYGLFSKIALLGIKLDKNKCTDCGLCLNVCKMDIKHVGDHECIHCGDCIAVCPAKAIRWKGSKLFVHENAVEAGAPVEEKPLGAFLKGENVAEATVSAEQPLTATPALLTVAAPAEEAPISELPAAEETEQAVAMAPAQSPRERERKRNFWLQFAAWAAALVVLIGAIVYYNFFDTALTEGKNEGDLCPQFSVQLTHNGGEYTLPEDKVVVINFWATWCGPCVAELPDFNQFKHDYPEVEVIAISEDLATENVDAYIDAQWADFEILFARDNMNGASGEVYSLLSLTDVLPVTLILDKDGVIVYNSPVSMSYERLVELVTPYL